MCERELTVLSGLVDASHGATGQDLEMVADPNTAVEQQVIDRFSSRMRTRTCVVNRFIVADRV